MNEALPPSPGTNGGSARVTLVLPCRAEYVGIARLAVLGIANRLPFSYDEVEDVRLAVGEACTRAIERARAASVPEADPSQLRIESFISGTSLTIEVHDTIPMQDDAEATVTEDGIDHPELGALLMEILVDEVEIDIQPAGTIVRLTKRVPLT